MATFDEIVGLLARAGVPYQALDEDTALSPVTQEYRNAIDQAMIHTGIDQYMYIQLLMRCIDQLYNALENTLDAYEEFVDQDEEFLWQTDVLQ